jgi:prepilin-type N-terminal cleavage/methylation domain-containing protein
MRKTASVGRQAQARGFTLVEIVVSLTLLGFGLMAVFAALRSCAGAAQHARMLTRSVLLAERLLVETRTSRQPTFETRNGQEGPYLWQVRLVPTTVEGLGAIHVQVTWPEQQRPQQYDLYSLIAMPSWAQWRG